MHLFTTVKVMASSEDEAIERVKDLVTDNGNYVIAPFDWVSVDDTRISEDVKSEADFLKLREMERDEYVKNLLHSNDRTLTENMKGFYIRLAGECLEDNNFWSTERLAYTLDWEDGENVYYVETDRHY